MKKIILVSISAASLFVAGLVNANNFEEDLPNDGGVFICEDTGGEGPMFYPAEYSTEITNEPNYSTQNGYTFSSMNYNNAHKYYRGDSVKVAVIDSGLNYTHEDFKDSSNNQIIQGNSRTIDNSSGSWLYYQFSSGYQSKIVDSLGHGTNVASVIASQINALGCAGIAPNVELYVYKVTNTSNGYEWTAINSALSYCISEGIDVINMSFQAYEHAVTYNSSTMSASTGCSSVMTSYLNSCYNAGITLVAAAGNYNTSEPSYPASNNHVISVGSLAESSTTTKAAYSNTYGIDLVAPGTVYVADKGTNSSYKKTSGTSFSAPIVTAAIALYKQQHPTATPSEIESALYASCDSISGNPSWAGNGRLNIDKFLGVENADQPTEIVINNSEIEDEEVTLEVGDTLDLDWTVNGQGSYSDAVTFSTYSGTNEIVTVNLNGRITAISEGEDIVTITSTSRPDVSVDIFVTVTSSGGSTPVVTQKNYTIGWGTASGTQGTYTNFAATSGSVTGILEFSSEKNNAGSGPAYNSSNSELRLYYGSGGNGGSIIITPSSDVTIVGFSMTTSTTPTVKYKVGNGSFTEVSCSSYTYTVSGLSVTSSLTIQNANTTNTQLRIKKITLTYTETSKVLSSISVSTPPTKTSYISGEFFDPTGLVITKTYSDSNTDSYAYSGHENEFSFSPTLNTALNTSNHSVIITYDGKKCSQNISVKSLTSIYVSTAPNKTEYLAGEYFDPTGLIIRRNYSDNSYDTYSYSGHTSEFTFSPTTSTALTTSDQTVTITYSNLTTTQSIVVANPKVLSSITITGQTTSFVEGDTFLFNGNVIAHFDDLSETDVTGDATFTGYVMNSVGNHTVIVSYSYRNVTKTETYQISIAEGILTGIEVSGMTTSYQKNYSFSFDGTCTATFENGYQKAVTPTNVSSPDMSTGGDKTIIVSFSYNGRTETANYIITVNSTRVVIEEKTTSIYSSYDFSSFTGDGIELKVADIQGCCSTTGGITTASTSSCSKAYQKTGYMRLATGSADGSVTFNFGTTKITDLTIVAKGWSPSEQNCTMSITNGGSVQTTSDSSDDTFNVSLSTDTNSITLSASSKNRICIKSIIFYKSTTTSEDIGQTEDCLILESFIDNNLHMNYVENLGYCSDSEHHYYSTAKLSFNNLTLRQRTLFTTNTAYLTEWTRLSTWASKNGDSLNGSNQLASRGDVSLININKTNKVGIILIISLISFSSVGAYIFIKRKKEDR